MATKSGSGKSDRKDAEETAPPGTPLGERLHALRLSLQSNDPKRPVVPRATMDRLLGSPNTRHIWQRLEQAGEASNPAHMQMVLLGVHNLVNALQVENKKRLEQQLVAFVRAERDGLPWREAPEWVEGFQVFKPRGRPRGSRAITAQKFIRPGQNLPDGYDVRAALPGPAPAPSVEQTNSAVLAILKAVQTGDMPLDPAVTVLRTLLAGACRHGQPTGLAREP